MAAVAMAAVLVTASIGACTDDREPSPKPDDARSIEATAGDLANDPPYTVSIRVTWPSSWLVVDGRPLTLREGTERCTYVITVTAALLPLEATTATVAAARLVPTEDGKVLETGRRGSAAWRVVRRRGSDPVRVDALRAEPVRFLSAAEGRPVWLTTEVEARSTSGSECHAGTWRETLGPAIGDLLATARRVP